MQKLKQFSYIRIWAVQMQSCAIDILCVMLLCFLFLVFTLKMMQIILRQEITSMAETMKNNTWKFIKHTARMLVIIDGQIKINIWDEMIHDAKLRVLEFSKKEMRQQDHHQSIRIWCLMQLENELSLAKLNTF